MSKLTVLSYIRSDINPLAPAPNVHEAEYISNVMKQDTTLPVTDLMAGPLSVIMHHRGSLLYCAGGVTVHRYNPSTMGANGYSSMPSEGMEEQVIIMCSTGRYAGVVRFE
jgi:hypothetical protein